MITKASETDIRLESALSAFRRLPVPEPSTDLLRRILVSRAGGTRVVLPVAGESGTRTRLRYAAMAAALVAASWLGFRALTSRPEHPHGPSLPPVVDGTPFLPSTVFSQEVRTAPRSPRYPLISRLEPMGVRAGRWTYDQRSIGDGVFVSQGANRAVRMTALTYQGKPAWLVTQGAGDSVVVDRSSLRPLRVVRPMWHARLVQQFSRDSLVEDFHATPPNEARNIHTEAALPGTGRDPLLISWSAYSLEAIVQALPLERNWRGSLYSVGWIFTRDRVPPFTPLDLRVTGTERIRVPAGTFDCWKLQVREGDQESIVWVSKQQRWVVMRAHTAFDDSGKWGTEWRAESRLVAADTADSHAVP